MKKDATQEGVSEAEADDATITPEVTEEQPVVKPTNPREAAMAAVISSRKEVLTNEGMEIEDEPAEPIADDETIDSNAIEDTEVVDEAIEDAPAAKTTNEKTVFVTLASGDRVEVPASSVELSVKVDGEESVKPLSEVSKSYQKDSALSKRMEETARKAKDLDQREQNIRLREQQNMQLSTDAASNAPPNQDARQRAQKIIDAMTEGTQEEAIEVLAEAFGNQPSQLDASKLTADVTQEVARNLEGKEAGQWFKSEYPDIMEDANLFNMADEKVTRLLDENPGMSHKEAFKKVGDETMEWVGKYRTTPPSNDLDERRNRKRAAAESIPKTTAKASIGKDAPPAPTNSQIISDMKRLRGQPI